MEKKCSKCLLTLSIESFCKKIGGKYGVSRICRSCSSKYTKDYYAANPDKRKERWLNAKANGAVEKNKVYHIKHREEILKKKRQYYNKNKSAFEERRKKYYESHKERVLQYGKEYREKNFLRFRDYFNMKHRENYHKNKEFSMDRLKRRRAIKANAIGSFTEKQVKVLFKVQKGKCALCQVNLSSSFHRDHIIPLCRNGENTIQNIQLLCKQCNLSKGTKDPIDYMKSKGYLL